MSTSARWILAVIMMFVLIAGTIMFSVFGLLMMAFATDSCRSLPDLIDYYIFLPPAVMVLGSLIGPILFGLNKRWYWWLGVIILSGVTSIVLLIAWLPLMSILCG